MNFNNQQMAIISHIKALLTPKPKIKGSDWVNNNFYLSPESSSAPGKMTLYPYQEEIIDEMTSEWTELVVLNKSARIGYNKLLNAMIAFFIAEDPSTMLLYSPNDLMSKRLAETEIDNMIRDNELVRDKIDGGQLYQKKKNKNTTMLKTFFGGYMEMLGAVSPNNFAQRTARIAIVDELSRWVDSIGKEGDGVGLAKKRISDFYNGKLIIGSSPTLKARNKIGKEFLKTDQRHRYLPCPFCDHRQILLFKNLKWDKDNNKELIESSIGFKCVKCEKLIRQNHHRKMDKAGKWVKHNPKAQRKAGFHIWAAYGYSPTMTWVGIVKEFLAVKDNPLELQVFTNTTLAEAWEDKGRKVDTNMLLNKKEEFGDFDLPENIAMVTMGTDTQNDRLESVVVAHGASKERWIIDRHVIFGDPADQQVWEDLDDIYNNATYTHPKGDVGIYAHSIDSGGGRTKYVYEYCKPRLSNRVYPIKGANSVDAKEVTRRDSATKKRSKYNITHFHIGVNRIKDYIDVGLQLKIKGANYIHFPDEKWVDEDFCNQLLSEYKNEDTQRWEIKRSGLRNEGFDTLVYAESAKLITGIDVDKLISRGQILGLSGKTTKKRGMVILSEGI